MRSDSNLQSYNFICRLPDEVRFWCTGLLEINTSQSSGAFEFLMSPSEPSYPCRSQDFWTPPSEPHIFIFSFGYRCQRSRPVGTHISKLMAITRLTTTTYQAFHLRGLTRSKVMIMSIIASSPAPSQYLQRRGVRTY